MHFNDAYLKFSLILSFTVFSSVQKGYSQYPDSTKVPARFGAVVTVTTKGISTIPNLTLGKPAAIFDMVVGRKLSFEPQFRFSLEAKPWSFLFWWRYKLVNEEKFKMNIGLHPAFSFQSITDSSSGVSQNMILVPPILHTSWHQLFT